MAEIFSVLIVDDDSAFHMLTRKLLEQFRDSKSWRISSSNTVADAKKNTEKQAYDFIFIDLGLEGGNDVGIHLLKELKEKFSETEYIVQSSQDSFLAAQSCLRAGASDYLLKGYSKEEFFDVMERAFSRRRWKGFERREKAHSESQLTRFKILGQSPAIRKLQEQIAKLANSEIPVLLEAETGSGKELVARNLHLRSQDPTRPFVAVDCAAIPASMAEGFLFGHEKGSFTGATALHQGVFEQANGGTLFLDEIASLSLELQIKFLRVLEEREVRRVGGNRTIPVQFRLLAAANSSIEELVERGLFKRDLYYRLQAITLKIPPLRERIEDLALLMDNFTGGKKFSPELWMLLEKYSWPGNIRECRNLCLALEALAGDVDVYETYHLPEPILKKMLAKETEVAEEEEKPANWKAWKGYREREFLQKAYMAAEGNVSRMARLLDVDRSHLFQKLKRYGIHEPQS